MICVVCGKRFEAEEEHKLITTNADEIIEQRKLIVETSENTINAEPKDIFGEPYKKVEINVDEEKGFYRHKDLSLPEIKYLLSKKYTESMQYLKNPPKFP
mgnify:FL=1